MEILAVLENVRHLHAMTALAYQPLISIEDYLSGEPLSEVRHEYVAGQVFAMAGGSRSHNELAGNAYSSLRFHLKNSSCRPFIGDIKVRLRIGPKDIFYYPDVVVGCDPRDTDEYSLRFPKLIIEVLSKTTERQDRLEKFEHYVTATTLEEYVLVAQNKMEVTLHRRRTNWAAEIYTAAEATFLLESVDLEMSVGLLYENIHSFPTTE